MRCAICGMEIASVDEAVEQGWTPYFYEGTQLHDVACPSCTETLLQNCSDGEIRVREEYLGKLRYLDEPGEDPWQDDSEVFTAVLEYEPGKLN
jgi:hypothetical protein